MKTQSSKLIGVTGGIGSGKTSVSSLLPKDIFSILEADFISRALTKENSPILNEIVNIFGKNILDSKGILDRKKLGAIVFKNHNLKLKLENLLHPAIAEKTLEWIEQGKSKNIPFLIYDVPLLFEKKLHDSYPFDAIVVVDCPLEERISRVNRRDGLTREFILDRIKNQVPLEEKCQNCDYVIDNSGNLKDLNSEVFKFINWIKEYFLNK